MEPKRIARIIGDRWVVVLTGALVGLVGALVFLGLAPSKTTLWQATAALRFDPAEGQTAQALAQELTSARDFAVSVAEETLSQDPTSQISVDLANSKLLFISQGSSELVAR